jgi:hypothetical protein
VTRRVLSVAAFLLAALPLFARAQGVAPTLSSCSYDSCALRVEPAFLSGPRLLRGRTGVEVGRLGAFGGGVDTLLAGPPLAVTHTRRYVRDIRTANTLGLLSAVAFVVVASRTDWFRDNANDGDVAIGLTGTALALVSIPFRLHAEQSLSRAVWFYNAALTR